MIRFISQLRLLQQCFYSVLGLVYMHKNGKQCYGNLKCDVILIAINGMHS